MPSLTESLSPHKLIRVSASDHITQILKDAIVEGLLPAGEVLKQDQIAAHVLAADASFVIRHSSFVIRHSSNTLMTTASKEEANEQKHYSRRLQHAGIH